MSQTIAARYRPGTLLAGRYEVTRLLSWGGMAEVYLARDRRLGRKVAVKVIREQFATDERFLTRFRREARAAAALSHRNIVSVHDVGAHQGSPFIVMEYVPGRTLAALVRDDGAQTPDSVAEIGEAAAQALSAAHAGGIVHRDVKPGNIMVTETGEVKILDFGIARAFQWTPLTDTATVHGTPEYMAPEQVRGEEADRRSDLYSLGAVLYELLTGRPPFTGETSLAVAYKHLEEPPQPPGTLRQGVPDGLSAILLRCLAKHPGDRYARADDLAADLRRFRAGEPPATAPVPAAPSTRAIRLDWDEPPARPRRRPVLTWALVTTLAVILGNLAVVAFLSWGEKGVAGDRPPRKLRPPTGLTASGQCQGLLRATVTLEWSPTVSRFADGYEIYRGLDSGGPYDRVAVLSGRQTTSFVDEDPARGTHFYYVVKATAGARTSATSGQAQAETPSICLW